MAARRGEREEMQDAHVILENYRAIFDSRLQQLSPSISYYAIFDGHAGTRAAEHAATRLHQIIANKFPVNSIEGVSKEIKKCLIDSFLACDKEFLVKASEAQPVWKDGSTAVVVLLINDVVELFTFLCFLYCH